MRFLVVASFVTAGAGCFEVGDRPDAGIGDNPEGEISGTVTVGDGSGTDPTLSGQALAGPSADARALQDLRRQLVGDVPERAAPHPVTRTPASDPPVNDDISAQMAAQMAAQMVPQWKSGDLMVSFPRRAFDNNTILAAVHQMANAASVKGVVFAVFRCDGRMWCTIAMKDEHGKVLDNARTKEVATEMHAHRVDNINTVHVNHVMRGFRRPNDDFYNIQWHYQFIHMEPAWDLEIGDDSVIMAVVDSGVVQGHPDLTGRLARETNNTVVGIDLMSDASIDDDETPGADTNPEDPGDLLFGDRSSYHGTHVSGTMAASTDNQEGVAGITWAGKLVPVRVLGRGLSGFENDILTGIFWAIGDNTIQGAPVNTKPARVVNLSLGGPIDAASQQNWDDAFSFIFADPENLFDDPVFVAAAGNSDADCSDVAPANVAGVIGVGAVGSINGIRAPYSNFGGCVDIMGPGGDNSTDLTGDGQADAVLSTYENDYDFEQGTSMASPHVAGVAALIIAQNPALTHGQVEDILKQGADPAGRCNEGCGAGWLDAFSSLLLSGGEIEPTARLAVDAATLSFGDGVGTRTFRILNTGNTAFNFTASVSGVQGDLFTLSLENGTVPAAEDGGSVGISVTLTRGQLESGSANIEINTVGVAEGEQTALVNLEFNDDPNRVPRLLDTVEVAAYISEGGSLKSVKKTTTSRAEHFAYKISGLVAGSYYVYAVADDNRDGTFDANVESVGGFPSVNSPTAVKLKDDQKKDAINFSLIPSFITGIVGGIGAACNGDGDCTFSPDAECITSFSGGYCSRFCDADGDCGEGGSCEVLGCVDDQGDPFDCGVCLLSCLSDQQCRFGDGYVCDGFGTCSPEDL